MQVRFENSHLVDPLNLFTNPTTRALDLLRLWRTLSPHRGHVSRIVSIRLGLFVILNLVSDGLLLLGFRLDLVTPTTNNFLVLRQGKGYP
jgi:hypothetical protein